MKKGHFLSKGGGSEENSGAGWKNCPGSSKTTRQPDGQLQALPGKKMKKKNQTDDRIKICFFSDNQAPNPVFKILDPA